jgi:hypothetical protein
MAETDAANHLTALARARQYRNDLMIALLAFHPVRLKNFFAIEMGRTFVKVKNRWWILLAASDTKERRPDERLVDNCLTSWIELYLTVHRPILARGGDAQAALWLSSNDGNAMTYTAVERVISQTTKETIGVDISPHLFRAASASSCAVWAGNQPYLASALLHHRDPDVTQEHYNRATSLSANQSFAARACVATSKGRCREMVADNQGAWDQAGVSQTAKGTPMSCNALHLQSDGGANVSKELGEFILPYDAVRTAQAGGTAPHWNARWARRGNQGRFRANDVSRHAPLVADSHVVLAHT